jgi:hypothetical protein
MIEAGQLYKRNRDGTASIMISRVKLRTGQHLQFQDYWDFNVESTTFIITARLTVLYAP